MIVGRRPGHPEWCSVHHVDPVHTGRTIRCWSSADASIVTHIEQRALEPRPMLVITVVNADGVTALRLPLDQALSMHVGMRACLSRAGGAR